MKYWLLLYLADNNTINGYAIVIAANPKTAQNILMSLGSMLGLGYKITGIQEITLDINLCCNPNTILVEGVTTLGEPGKAGTDAPKILDIQVTNEDNLTRFSFVFDNGETIVREVEYSLGSSLPSNYEIGKDGIYIADAKGDFYPIKHPDISTQPSILPNKFGGPSGYPVYEVVLPMTEESIEALGDLNGEGLRNIGQDLVKETVIIDAKLHSKLFSIPLKVFRKDGGLYIGDAQILSEEAANLLGDVDFKSIWLQLLYFKPDKSYIAPPVKEADNSYGGYPTYYNSYYDYYDLYQLYYDYYFDDYSDTVSHIIQYRFPIPEDYIINTESISSLYAEYAPDLLGYTGMPSSADSDGYLRYPKEGNYSSAPSSPLVVGYNWDNNAQNVDYLWLEQYGALYKSRCFAMLAVGEDVLGQKYLHEFDATTSSGVESLCEIFCKHWDLLNQPCTIYLFFGGFVLLPTPYRIDRFYKLHISVSEYHTYFEYKYLVYRQNFSRFTEVLLKLLASKERWDSGANALLRMEP